MPSIICLIIGLEGTVFLPVLLPVLWQPAKHPRARWQGSVGQILQRQKEKGHFQGRSNLSSSIDGHPRSTCMSWVKGLMHQECRHCGLCLLTPVTNFAVAGGVSDLRSTEYSYTHLPAASVKLIGNCWREVQTKKPRSPSLPN